MASAAGALLASLALAPGPASAHPTHKELLERARSAGLCARASNPGAWRDTVGLGTSEAALREAWSDALVARSIEVEIPDFQRGLVPEKPGTAVVDPFAGQQRLRRQLRDGDVRYVEYELFGGRVYRIRWQLGLRFERPLLDDLVHQAAHCYGPPDYDQTIEAKIGSGEVTRRRVGWERGDRLLEVRQLNPLAGGPVFVTVTELTAGQAIIAAKGSLAPEPERRAEAWWQRGSSPPAVLGSDTRDELVRAFAAVLSATDFQSALEKPAAAPVGP